ncbi:Fas apoptotic inhibitory molecule 1 [Caenorhabditis elegans]|uniref:Fas apoptotic inhibitory molecule 1 n=1 Tax=Caenorhabditis elegans TaxID=6239 RepID=O01908_CAEEL|nr:Fas apoptotic inhibitory molecule 1 [Caenorhabditis elegans]CCD67208.1 Fas apoptotic inhibitory molecule 1 [Caenorhabditis elegans]|eukprot:NP_497664.2 Uncharacterized protein CELE_C44B11.1 [Caenorhabditis elegans]
MPEGDVVATWNVPLHAQVHKIEFEHGTTTGKRVIRIDGNEILRRDWMFKLVGKEAFKVGDMKCIINVEALGTFAYEYSLDVNGKTFNKFKEEQNKRLHSWETTLSGHQWRVVLDKESMEIWANGNNIDTAGEFVDNGTVTHFELGKNPCKIIAQSSGKKKTGVTHTLYVNGEIVPSTVDKPNPSNQPGSS